MITKTELIRWLNTLTCESVAIDEGGLTLCEIEEDGHPTEDYLEIGGFPKNPEPEYNVVVGNIGTIYESTFAGAKVTYSDYVNQSRSGRGRAGGEPVTLLKGEEIIKEYIPKGYDPLH